MVRIITGKINSGKTTRIYETYKNQTKGNGIISKKYMIGKDVFGFNALVLKDETEYPYLIHINQLSDFQIDDFVFLYNIGPYLVYKTTIELIDQMYETWIKENVTPLYFDEVGKLELSGKGFHCALKGALEKNLDVYMTVRDDLIEAVLEKFEIKEYELI